MPPARIFISYASEDDAHRIALEKHLIVLRREELVEPWSDRKILPGGAWGDEIDLELERADLVLALVSADFLASSYCYEIEMARALERHAAGEARVVPVIVESCDWQHSPLGELQALPERARPVALWPHAAEAWTNVVKAIRRLLAERMDARAAADVEAVKPDPTRYLEALLEEHSSVEIRGMGAQVSERLPLQQVYTRLHVSAPAQPEKGSQRRGGDGEHAALLGARDQELKDVLAREPHVALIGDPGSGKTTFLRYVALQLCRAQLGEPDALQRIGLPQPAPFPIFVRLERLARFLTDFPEPSIPEDAVEHFYRYLDWWSHGRHLLPETDLRKRVRSGRCFLLLDGLDEVPGEALRERLARLVERVIVQGTRDVNRHLVTCRTRAYEGRVQLAGALALARLAAFGPAEVEQFCEGWSRALFRASPDDPADPARLRADAYQRELMAAVEANPEAETFAGSPLMLTVLAVVYWNRRQLPEQRAELYDAALEYLLESRGGMSSHPTPLRRECLQAAALALFQHEEGVQRSLGRPEVAEAVAPILGADPAEAIRFLEEEELYSGVLVSRSAGEVEFWHLMFQEYLAALEIAGRDDGWSIVAPHLADDRWAELLLLLASCRRRTGGVRAARRLIEQVLASGTDPVSEASSVALVSRMLRDVRPYGGDPAAGTEYEKRLQSTLGIFEPGGEPVAERVRIEVGEALGRAGDPRLSRREDLWVRVPGGSFWMGSQTGDPDAPGYDAKALNTELPRHEVEVADLVVGCYPVTVAEYAPFVADGYANPRHWAPDGWAWREQQGIEAPDEWEAQQRCLTRPVVGVSFWEADAFARAHGKRLPAEAEWEWIARGAAGRRFPWGVEDPTEHLASFDGRFAAPPPVGIYPLGATPEGIHDLSGTVWEWCASPWTDGYAPGSEEYPGRRVLRGGSFSYGAHYLRAACRSYGHPVERFGNVGLRLVSSFPGGQG